MTIASAAGKVLAAFGRGLIGDSGQVVHVEDAHAVAVVDARVEVARHRHVEDHETPAAAAERTFSSNRRRDTIGSGAPVVLSTMSA